MKLFILFLISLSLVTSVLAERQIRKFTVPLQPGDEQLLDECPFIVDKDRQNYPKLTPQEMTTAELNQHFLLMTMKRKRRDNKLLQKNNIDINKNPYKEK